MMDPIYLFTCGILWRKVADIQAGRELAQALCDGDRDMRFLAWHLLLAAGPRPIPLLEDAICGGVLLPTEASQCTQESLTGKVQPNCAAYGTNRREGAEILIIDDDDQVLVKLEQVLEAAGYRTTTTWCARQAVSLLKEKQFDSILLDDYLGAWTGRTCCSGSAMNRRTLLLWCWIQRPNP